MSRPRPTSASSVKWTVYILECSDRTLYTGITTDMARRLKEHAAGTGAKYTKRRGPFTVRYTEGHRTRSDALKREAAIKSLDRSCKIALIATVCLVNEKRNGRLASAAPAKKRPQPRGQYGRHGEHPAGNQAKRP